MPDSNIPDAKVSTPSDNLAFSPAYTSVLNSITQPDKYVFVSRYLVEKWMPDLGPNAFAILCFLRRECFYNRSSGELRNELNKISLPDIAKGSKLSVSTVRRELQSNDVLKKFVKVVHGWTPSPDRGGVRMDRHTYTVTMDDPLHPSDSDLLQERLRHVMAMNEKAEEDPKQRAIREGRVALRQNGTAQQYPPVKMTREGVNLELAPTNLEPPPCQNDVALIDYSSLPENTKNTLRTSDFSASLFSGKKELPKEWDLSTKDLIRSASERHGKHAVNRELCIRYDRSKERGEDMTKKDAVMAWFRRR